MINKPEHLNIQEKVIDGVTKYYYWDEAQLLVGYFDTKEQATESLQELSNYLMQTINQV